MVVSDKRKKRIRGISNCRKSFCNKVKKGEEVGVGLKICMLLFVSFLGGILALCMGEAKEKNN